MTIHETFGYTPNKKYTTRVAYFSMEYAIDQALKIYSGGLGFLSGSHLRSAYELNQNLIGIGILWKYGYYEQVRDCDGLMKADFIKKEYAFLEDTGITFMLSIHNSPLHVKAYLLKPETFGTAPLFLLSTDIPENDELSRSITHCLYHPNESTRIAQSIVVGYGGASLLDILGLTPDIYQMNEGHSLCLCFYLHGKYQNLRDIKKRVVFTTHTPEMAGNETHNYTLLEEMSFFNHLQATEVKRLLNMSGESFNYTLAAFKLSGKANCVSKLHTEVTKKMWSGNLGLCEITSITNAQNKTYWKDPVLDAAIVDNNDGIIVARKKELKRDLFKVVADQCGKLFDEDTLTIVWAKRFAGYKRADLIIKNRERFVKLLEQTEHPIQLIWAGKPYPEDKGSINQFNQLITQTKEFPRCAVLTGYELSLSALLKKGSDIWLNTPRLFHEASGTSGMTAAMNGSINVCMPDGWAPEFAHHLENCFLIQPAPDTVPDDEKDQIENNNLLNLLEQVVIPMYYRDQQQWLSILKKAAADVTPAFESGRLADEYYLNLYTSYDPERGNHPLPGGVLEQNTKTALT